VSQARPLSPGAERRRQLRQQQRRERLLNGWRFLVLLGLATGLGYGLLRLGWTLSGPEQVEVLGSRQVTTTEVITAAGIRFPQPLLSLDPRRIAAKLGHALPVEEVQVSRLMAPPRLRVVVVDRQPVARAERRGPQGVEQGFVDRLGNWMTARQGQGLRNASTDKLLVQGWQPRHRAVVSRVLGQPDKILSDDLIRLRFDPAGIIWVDSTVLGTVRLGPGDGQLEQRLKVLDHLVATLPGELRGKRLQSVDLTDPDQPELAIAGGSTPPKPASPTP
jgi:cell division protein FtsQ